MLTETPHGTQNEKEFDTCRRKFSGKIITITSFNSYNKQSFLKKYSGNKGSLSNVLRFLR